MAASTAPHGFGNLPADQTRPGASRFWVLPVPYEKTTTYGKGTGRGPAAILEASGQVELWDEELLQETCTHGVHTLPAFRSNKAPAPFVKDLDRHVRGLLGRMREDQVLVSLGGEHNITAGIVPAFAARHADLSILHFDAHADLRDEYDGSPFNHACALRRCLEHAPIVQVGIRNYSAGEAHLINSERVRTFLAHEWHGRWAAAAKEVVKALSPTVYVTFDIDGIDPSEVPGTGTPEPGGLSWFDALDVLRPVFAQRRVVGIDVMEVAPVAGSHVSEFFAAKLIYRMMGYKTKGR